MIRWAGLAPWEREFPFPGSLISTFLVRPNACLWVEAFDLGFGVLDHFVQRRALAHVLQNVCLQVLGLGFDVSGRSVLPAICRFKV